MAGRERRNGEICLHCNHPAPSGQSYRRVGGEMGWLAEGQLSGANSEKAAI